MQTEMVLRRLHITDVAETGCQAECTRQEAGCQTDACQAALAGLAVVSGGLAESVAISGGVTPKRSGGKQRKAWRQARRQREAAQLEAQQLLAAMLFISSLRPRRISPGLASSFKKILWWPSRARPASQTVRHPRHPLAHPSRCRCSTRTRAAASASRRLSMRCRRT